MSSIPSVITLSHAENVSDGTRERELYKYYQPTPAIVVEEEDAYFPRQEEPESEGNAQWPHVTSNIASSKISSPDTALTAFCQLVTWRLSVERAMISLIDSDTQYFIAESTKTLDLVDNRIHGEGDGLWMGCGQVSKAGRLCERTIEVAPTENDYPCFIVNDLSADERFNELPFVTGPPYLRFYAGVPLITKRGIPIGSLFIVDSHVRPSLSTLDVKFMGTMAVTVMKHLEMTKSVEDLRRGMRMSRGLASFVEGRSELVEIENDANHMDGSNIEGSYEADTGPTQNKPKSGNFDDQDKRNDRPGQTDPQIVPLKQEPQGSFPEKPEWSQAASNEMQGQDKYDPPPREDKSESSPMKTLFARASNLIREAFELDGGAVFYDAQRGVGDSQLQQLFGGSTHQFPDDSQTSSDDFQAPKHSQDDRKDDLTAQKEDLSSSKSRFSTGLRKGKRVRSTKSSASHKIVEILGFSTAEASSSHGDEYPGPQSFVPLNEKSLQRLLRRYPRGKLWTFDSDGAVSSSSEEEPYNISHWQVDTNHNGEDLPKLKGRDSRAKSDAKYLSTHFPGMRQLLFVPLWDSSRARWLAGCFIWNTEATRIFTKQNELAFLTAFGNSVMAECSRIDTEIADQKKSDFIGSISHELRSPLHGILASSEFLGEEVETSFEKGLVETIDSCGRTLLDTINHILDFSKINHFEKNWRKTRRGGRPLPRSSQSVQGVQPSDLPMINLFADVDISVVCEEVLEGVFAGHVFQHQTASSFDMVHDSRGKMSDNALIGLERSQETEVAVILDVDMQDYHFTTQPGAFRRVIMNLLGNALKYTSRGYVRISLAASEMEDLQLPGGERVPRSMVTVTVADTGKGISADFLRTKLFTPFAQENSLSSGTGLGLSMVKSIVRLLEGDLVIDSELGRGTQAKVMIPLLKDMPKTADSNSSSTPKSSNSIARENDESISLLRSRVIGQKVSLFGFDNDPIDPVMHRTGKLLQASITNFLTNWYGLKVVPSGQRTAIVVLNEASSSMISKVLKQGMVNGKTPAILVLCSHTSKLQRPSSELGRSANICFVAKPVGPLKLARALSQCLEEAPSAITPGLLEGPPRRESNDLSAVFEEMSLSPHSGELLDNSRMAADSDNARKVIESHTPTVILEKHNEFPFPVEHRPTVPPKSKSMPGDKDSLQPLAGNKGLSGASAVLSQMEIISTSNSSLHGTAEATSVNLIQSLSHEVRLPRLLLVDDNSINLSLLRAYMKKRKYDVIELAENGLQAVQKFEKSEDGFDIIFMDISMPVLNGFDATKKIRTIEESRRNTTLSTAGMIKVPSKTLSPALIIALTGLASSQDQAEAASVGIDVFLTKPVAFKEVGKMLDNWQANRERDSRSSDSSF